MRPVTLALLVGVSAALPASANAQPRQQASDFASCVRTDDGRPACFHRRTGRLTLVPERIYSEVVGPGDAGTEQHAQPRSREPIQVRRPGQPAQSEAATGPAMPSSDAGPGQAAVTSAAHDLLCRGAFGADVLLFSDYDAGTALRRHLGIACPAGSRVSPGQALALLLRLKADPAALTESQHFVVPSVLPQRLSPYLSSVNRERLASGGTLDNGGWAGRNEFELRATRQRFIDAEGPHYTRLIPELPLTVAFVHPLVIREQYDFQRQMFRLNDIWANGGVMPTTHHGGIEVPRPYAPITTLAMPPEAAQTLRARQTTLVEQERARRTSIIERNGLNEFTSGPHQFLVVHRYQIGAVRRAGSGVVADTAAIDVRVFDPTNLYAPYMEIPLPDNAVRAGPAGASAGPAQGEPVLLDQEVPLLLMAREQPALVSDQAFAALALRRRHDIEMRNRMNCGSRAQGGGTCIPTSWRGVLPSGMTARSLPDRLEPGDIAAYQASLRERMSAIGDRVAAGSICEGNPGVCRPTQDGKVQVSLSTYFGGTFRDSDVEPVRRMSPGITRITTYSGLGAMRIADQTMAVLVAQRPNAAWDDLVIEGAASIGVEFRLARSFFGPTLRDGSSNNYQPFVIELEPTAVVRTLADGRTERRSLETGAADRAALTRTGETPSAPWQVLGIRLGMPFDEAVRTLREHAPAEGVQEQIGLPNAEGVGECRRMVDELRRTLGNPVQITGNPAELSPRERRRIVTDELQTRWRDGAAAMRQANCQDLEAGPLILGFAMTIQHPDTVSPGDGAREVIGLFRQGTSLGQPVVTAVFRGRSVDQRNIRIFRDALIQHFGEPTVRQSSQDEVGWLETATRRPLFLSDQCGFFWPGGGSDNPNIPGPYLARDCGAFMRFSKDRVLLMDTTYIQRALARQRQQAPASQPQSAAPRIRM